MEPRMGQPIPHHEGLFVWCPQHRHPLWHNEGDSASLFPSIALTDTNHLVWERVTTDCDLSQISDLAHYRL